MRFAVLTLTALLSATPAFAVDLTYNCTGLWAARAGVFNASSTISGHFSPENNQETINVSLSTGGQLAGVFQGPGPDNSSGQLALQNGSLTFHGSLMRLEKLENIGFVLESTRDEEGWFKLILSCTRNPITH